MPLYRRHLLDVADFTRDEFSLVLDTAGSMREIMDRPISRVPTLRGKTIVNMFYEVSTRTRVSFELAAKNLSADVVNVSAIGSSVEKGESLVDTFQTIQALGADLMVMRHPRAGAPDLAARHLHCGVVNAGDGTRGHPSQALLDLYTVRERLGDIENRKVVIVGDILHSRVARSDVWAFSRLGAHVFLCGPPSLLPDTFRDLMNGDGTVRIEYDLDEAIRDADVVMALRLQKERMTGGLLPDLREYARLWGLNATRLKRAARHALVMHPGPINEGLEIAADVAHGPQSVIEEQVANGVAVRMAILYLLLAGRGPGTA
ncbi:MAG: aspartate carbamoyltransferase catalytic subunit [Actinobacteria bacterium]|nr:aspartate carbamoyltransferase catalytic subunit [Actinomycetota bacterium]